MIIKILRNTPFINLTNKPICFFLVWFIDEIGSFLLKPSGVPIQNSKTERQMREELEKIYFPVYGLTTIPLST